jgi:hypothetical protein
MLLKIERIILKKISKTNFSIELSEIGKFDEEDVYQAFLDLQDKGYVTKVSTSADRSNFSFIVSPKGRFYKEYFFLSFLRNILIPFVVAIITATSTYHLEKVADSYSDSSSSQ